MAYAYKISAGKWVPTGNKLWYGKSNPCKYAYGVKGRLTGKSLSECKSLCISNNGTNGGEVDGCNAIQWYSKKQCDLYNCPFPIPQPLGYYGNDWYGFYLGMPDN